MNEKHVEHPGACSPDLELAIEAARRGGSVLAEHFNRTGGAEFKPGGKGLVTMTDKAAEEIILETLRSKSSYGIMSEESAPNELPPGYAWVVDPLDGTMNFANSIPLCVVSIALAYDGEPLIGVIVHPLAGECFYAEKGKGAYLNGRPISVSPENDPAASVCFLNQGYRGEDKRRTVQIAERLIPEFPIRALGATALELAHLAAGHAGAFICSGDEFWDYAAGVVLVEEAGGKVTDWKGEAWNYVDAFLLASNGVLHQTLIRQIADLQL